MVDDGAGASTGGVVLLVAGIAATVVAQALVYVPLFRAVNCYTAHPDALISVCAAALISIGGGLAWVSHRSVATRGTTRTAGLVILALIAVLTIVPFVVIGGAGGTDFIEAERAACGRTGAQTWLLAAVIYVPIGIVLVAEVVARLLGRVPAVIVVAVVAALAWAPVVMFIDGSTP